MLLPGHADIAIDGIVYSFGRYDEEALESFGLRGDGVMIRTPEDITDRQQLDAGKTITKYTVHLTDEQFERLNEYFKNLVSEANAWEDKDGTEGVEKFKFDDSHQYSDYALISNNCTTFVGDALSYAMGDELPLILKTNFIPVNMDRALQMIYDLSGNSGFVTDVGVLNNEQT